MTITHPIHRVHSAAQFRPTICRPELSRTANQPPPISAQTSQIAGRDRDGNDGGCADAHDCDDTEDADGDDDGWHMVTMMVRWKSYKKLRKVMLRLTKSYEKLWKVMKSYESYKMNINIINRLEMIY